MASKRRVRWTVGDVVAIPLGDGRTAFGLLLEAPLVAFFDVSVRDGQAPSVDEIVRSPVAFRIWVMLDPIASGLWPVIGHVPVPDSLLERPFFFKQDPLSGRVTVGRTGAEELEPEPGQVEKLECAAVWSDDHVVDRLRDHFDGRPNDWVKLLKVKEWKRS